MLSITRYYIGYNVPYYLEGLRNIKFPNIPIILQSPLYTETPAHVWLLLTSIFSDEIQTNILSSENILSLIKTFDPGHH